METAIQLKESTVSKRSRSKKRSKTNGNVNIKINKVEELDKPESRKNLGSSHTENSTSNGVSVTSNSDNKPRSILTKQPVKLSPKPKSSKSKLTTSTLKDTNSTLSSKPDFSSSSTSKTKVKNSSSQNNPQKPNLLGRKSNLDNNKSKKPSTGNKNLASSRKLTEEEVAVNIAKKSNLANGNKVETNSKDSISTIAKTIPPAPISRIITNFMNGSTSNDLKIPVNTYIKHKKNKVLPSSQCSQKSNRHKSNSIPKNIQNPENISQSMISNEKLTKTKEAYSHKPKPEVFSGLSKKERNATISQNTSKHSINGHSKIKDICLRNNRITSNISKPISIKGIVQNKTSKSLFEDKAEMNKNQLGTIYSNHSTMSKAKDKTSRKLFDPKTDNPIPSNKPQSQILCQSVKYQDYLMVEIRRLTDLIDLENNPINTDIAGWKRLVLNHNQLMSIYKKLILNHYQTFNKLEINWLKQSWEMGTFKLLNQLDLINITKNKLKYALIRAIILNSEQIYRDLYIVTDEFPEFEGLRQLFLGELGTNRIKNGLLDINLGQTENSKQSLIDSTRKHLLRAMNLNPNLGSAYHQLASFNILLDTKDILPCMLLYSISSVSDVSEFNTTKSLNELYKQYNWDPSPLHSLLQIFCKLAIKDEVNKLGDQISKWVKNNQNINWSCMDLFNLTVIGLISYVDFGRSPEGLKYQNNTQIPLIQLILTLFDTNITNLNTQQADTDYTLLVHSLTNFYLWINCNKLYPCQFNYSDPNPISISEGWSTIVNGLNLLYFKLFSDWDSSNIMNDYSSTSTPLSWLDTFKSKIVSILADQSSQIFELDSSNNLNYTTSDCLRSILELGLYWTKLPKSIIEFNPKYGFLIHMNNRVYSSQYAITNDMATLNINSSDDNAVSNETYSTPGTTSPVYINEKIAGLMNQVKALTGYIDGNIDTEQDFSQVNPEDLYLVFDTNFILNHFYFIEKLINLRSVRVIIPALAITELKGLCMDVNTSTRCNRMLCLLDYLFSPPGPPDHIKILTTQGNPISHPHYAIERLPKGQHYKSKDIGILELCKLLSSKHSDKHIGLITDDKNMRIRARSFGIEIFSKNKVTKLLKNGLH